MKRGLDPEAAIGLGYARKKIKNWMDDKNIVKATHYTRKIDNIFFIDVTGNVVLEDFDIINEDGIKGIFEIEFGNVTGSITILNQLSKGELYTRIRNYYIKVIGSCSGKTPEEQADYLFGKNEKTRAKWLGRLKAGVIGNSKTYIKNLPAKPTQEQINKLVEKVLSGGLEYGYQAKDKYCVDMGQYAKALGKM